MIGPSVSGQGGIASVIAVYRDAGLMRRWGIRFVPTFCEGNLLQKVWIAYLAVGKVLWHLAFYNVRLVHIHSAQNTSFYRKLVFILIARIFDRPYLFHLHGATFDEFYVEECGALRKALIRWAFRNAGCVIALTSAWGDWVRTIEPRARVTVIHNPVHIPKTPVVCDRIASDGVLQLLFLGRLGQRKGIYDLLDALVLVAHEFNQFKLLCGGDGELELVRTKALALGLTDHVQLLGWVTGEDKERLVAASAIYVLPSYHEGLPMGVLEAMAAGLPVVTTDLGGMRDAIDDEINGFLVDPGDVSRLAQVIGDLLHNPELRVAVGNAGRAKAIKAFATPIIFEQVGRLYASFGAVDHEQGPNQQNGPAVASSPLVPHPVD